MIILIVIAITFYNPSSANVPFLYPQILFSRGTEMKNCAEMGLKLKTLSLFLGSLTIGIVFLNPFKPNVPFLYPLKVLQNLYNGEH